MIPKSFLNPHIASDLFGIVKTGKGLLQYRYSFSSFLRDLFGIPCNLPFRLGYEYEVPEHDICSKDGSLNVERFFYPLVGELKRDVYGNYYCTVLLFIFSILKFYLLIT